MVKRISEVEGEPQVGKFYLVPCVLTRDDEWVPVIGPRHDDAGIINFPEQHYHRDARFTSDASNAWFADVQGILEPSPERYAMVRAVLAHAVKEGPVERRVRCRRRMPAFPLELRYRNAALFPARAPWFEKLQDAYADARGCARCPHRGMPLKGLPVKDGKVICPGHGLQFDAETGALVRRA